MLILLAVGTPSSFAQDSVIEHRVDQVVSVFEYGSTEVQYCTIEDIHDGRGYTAGRAGFTTATGDFYELILRYRKLDKNSPFNPYESLLKERARDMSSSVKGLEEVPMIWSRLCATDLFKSAQDQLVEDFYKKPARLHMKEFGIKSALGYLIFHDTILQQGDGQDPDSFIGVISKMKTIPANEKDFLIEFLNSRAEILIHPHNAETEDVWKDSVDRAYALRKLVESERFNLNSPFKLHVWDTDWSIQ